MKEAFSNWIIAGILVAIVFGLTLTWSEESLRLGMDESTNPDDREQWWSQVNGVPPTARQLEQAYARIDRQLRARDHSLYRDAGINEWEDLGPKNIGGRIRAVAVNPDNASEIFIGGVAGGVWRTQNGGTTWSEVTPTRMSYPVTSIAIDPSDSDIIYATTGEYNGSNHTPGVGVLKSVDGGTTWDTTARPTVNFLWLGKIIINPLDADVLYVVGSTADSSHTNMTNLPGGNPADGLRAVFRSNDAGNSWTQLFNGGNTFNHVWDIEMNPDDTSELVIGTRYGAWISTNSGMTWNSLMGSAPLISSPTNYFGRRCELSYCESNPSTIYLLRYVLEDLNTSTAAIDTFRSQLWQTTNGGSNWSMLANTQGTDSDLNILTRQGDYDNMLWVDPSNCNRAIMGGINLWKWSNSTLSRISMWEDDIGGNDASGNNNSVHADQHILVPEPSYNGSTNKRVYIGNDGGIYFSDDIWAATMNSGWGALNSDINITQLYGVDVSLSGDTLVGGAQDNSYFVEQTGNNSDVTWGVYSTGDGTHCAIKKSDPNTMYACLQSGRVFRSTDGGNTFCRIMVLDNTNGGLQCVVSGTNVFSSFNDSPLFIAPFEMDPNDDTRIYVGGQRLWRSNDEGVNWQIIKGDIVPTRQISTIEIDKGNSNVIWVGYDNGTVSMTTDGGANWSNVDNNTINIPNQYITDIAIDPNDNNDVFVTVAGGFSQNIVYYTNDAGTTWSNRSPDFDLIAYAVTYHPEQSTWVYIGTPLGIFASEDDGVTWNVTPIYDNSDGPVYTPIVELVWQGDGSDEYPYYLVAATHGRGVWRTSFPIRGKLYVDRLCNPCGDGTVNAPYQNFPDAVDAAGNGAEIIFLRGGTYNNAPPSIVTAKRLSITLDAASSSVIIE